MRFATIHKVSSYLMVLLAFGGVALSGELDPVTIGLTLLGIAASWFFEPPRFRPERWATLWNIAAVAVLALTVVAMLGGDAVISSFARLLAFFAVVKLFGRVHSRDYLWIYCLSFGLLVAGAGLNGDFSYGLCFLGYAIATTWALTLFHLRRDMVDNLLEKHADGAASRPTDVDRILASRRIVGPKFLAGTAALSLLVFAGAAVFFLVFPRIGFGLFVQQSRAGITMAGFRDGVSLGGHGLIRSDPTVVMRVFFTDPGRRGAGALDLHFRGAAFDHYERGAWSRTRAAARTRFVSRIDLLSQRASVHLVQGTDALGPGDPRRLAHALRQEIFLEPLDAPVLFGASRPLTFELDARQLTPQVRRGNESSWQNDEVRTWHTSGLRYVVYSDPITPDRDRLAAAPEVSAARFGPYLQVPAEVPARVGELARRIVSEAGARTPYEKALAVRTHLMTRYGYSLEMDTAPGREPLDYFLFDRQRGHCEYFSTAMAILLREVGVPTRNVNGFLGGEWNDYGGYLAVRGGDAHSWVEVYLEGAGWVTFDPTPSAPSSSARHGRSLRDRARMFLDSVRLKWLRWVVDYDLGQQLGLMQRAGRWLRLGRQLGVSSRSFRDAVRRHRNELGASIAAGAALCVLVRLWLWRRRGVGPRDRARRGARHPVVPLYLRVAARLARRGHRRPAATTPREHATSLRAAGCPGADAFAELTELYYTARFADDPGPIDLGRAHRLADEITAALRRKRKPSSCQDVVPPTSSLPT